MPLQNQQTATSGRVAGAKQQRNPLMIAFAQLKIMLWRNSLLQRRFWRSTLAQTLGAPLVFLFLLFVLQRADYSAQSTGNPNPPEAPLTGVYRCQGRVQDTPCINVLFWPSTPTSISYINTFAKLNAARTGEQPFAIEQNTLANTNFVPTTRQMDFVPVSTSDLIYQYALLHPNVTAWGIVFHQQDPPNLNVQYQVWYNSTRINNGSDVYGRQLVGFLRGMDEAILSVLNDPTATVTANIDVTVRDWPVVPPPVLSDTIVQNLGPVFFFCSVMVIFINALNQIITEKEQKLRLGMETMGLWPVVYWLSMFLSTSLLVLTNAFFTCILGLIFQFNAFKGTNFGVLYFTFFLFGESMILFAFFITTLVRRTSVGILVGIFIFIIGLLFESFVFSSSFVGYIWWKSNTASFVPSIMSLLPFFNFGKCFLDISSLTTGRLDELTSTYVPGPGYPWSTLYSSMPDNLLPMYPDNTKPSVPPTIQSWNWMLIDMLFYALLTWYLDCVVPDEFGSSLSQLFFLNPLYWGIETNKHRDMDRLAWLRDVMGTSARSAVSTEDSDVSLERSRAISDVYWPAAKIVHLRKVYKTFMGKPTKIAVKDLSLTIEEGKLLALLGQNGAGKSTTMNILSGLTPATSGDAMMYGLLVHDQMHRIRKMMGVCPQHDILFDDLTAREHIYLYAGLKGVPQEQWEPLLQDRLQAVRLLKVANQRTGTYSGGMKRRLSLIISTIGDPRIVFLDEPTTGMDPVNRRHVWTFIERFKRNRIIILTTHSMEEADVLGDRIAIMAHGRLRAIGTSVSLKNKFGTGYRISVVTDPAWSANLKHSVQMQVPEAVLEDDSAGALMYQFPPSSMHLIPNLIRFLDSNTGGLVKSWGVSQTTLEEVFLKIVHDANPNGYISDERYVHDDAPMVSGEPAPLSGSSLRPRLSMRRRVNRQPATPVPSAEAGTYVMMPHQPQQSMKFNET